MRILQRIIITLILTFLIVFSKLPASAFAASENGSAVLTLRSTQHVNWFQKGSTFDVEVLLSNNTGITSAEIIFNFDSKLLLVGASTEGALSSDNWSVPNRLDSVSSTCTFLYQANDPYVNNEPEKILTLTFKASEDITVNKLYYITADSDMQNNDFDVNCDKASCKFVAIDYLPGDVNNDGMIKGYDSTLIQQYIVDGRKYNPNGYGVHLNEIVADVSADGVIRGNDSTKISQFIVDGRKYNPNGYAVSLLAREPAHIHSLKEVEAVTVKCEQDGSIPYWQCSDCGKLFRESSAKNEITLQDTIIPALGHTPVTDPAVPPTDTSTGLTEGSHCSACGKVLVYQEIIPIPKRTEYSITYNIAGNDTYLQGLNIENTNPSLYAEGDEFDLKELKVEGYIFEGWYDGQGSAAKRVTQIDKNTKGDKEFYAKWTLADAYSVVFKYDKELAGLIDVSKLENFTYNVNSAKALPVLSLPSYTFIGWSDEYGRLCDQITPGTTGNKTFFANFVSDRSKAQTAKNIGAPFIFEDDQQVIFTYEIGRVEDVPVCKIEDFGKINANGVGEKRTTTVSTQMEKSYIDSFSSAVEKATTGNATWTLSNGWTDSVNINNEWAAQSGMSQQDAETYSKSETNNWFVNTTRGGASTETVIDSNQNYATIAATNHVYNNYNYDHDVINTKTTEKGWDVSGKVELGTSQSISANAKASAKASAAAVGVVPGVIGGAEAEAGAEAGVGATMGAEQKLTLAGGYQNKTTTVDGSQTNIHRDGGHDINTAINAGEINQHSTQTSNTSTWNNQSGFGNSTTDGYSKSVAQTISQMISEKTGYGKSYIQTGNNSQTQGLSTTNANTDTFSSQVIRSTVTKEEITVEYDTSAAATGYHRWVMATTAHVFGVVGYDKKNDSYFTSTYTIMDDDYHRFQDYSYKTASYDDNMSCVIDFCVPDDIKSYVEGRMLYTEGLEFDLDGYVTAYTGSATAVIIPEYVVIDNLDKTKELVKVIGIRDGVFTNNTNITGVVLSEFITDIPDNAFSGCSSLWEIYGASVTSIGANAFAGCEKLCSFTISPDVTTLGNNAFSSTDFLEVKAANADVVKATLNSNAKEIVIDLKNFTGTLDNMDLEVPEGTRSLTLRAYGNSYENLTIVSHAEETKIARLTVHSNTAAPIKIYSDSVVLNQVNVSATGIAVALCNENTDLKLYGPLSVATEGETAILCKNVNIDRIPGNFNTSIDVSGNIVPCGTVSDAKNLIHFVRGNITESITEEMFLQMLDSYVLFFDTNDGQCDETSRVIKNGAAVEELPVPTRDGFSFDGWYLDDESTEVTEETVFSDGANKTIYAHWTPDSYTIRWNEEFGYTVEAERTSSPYQDAEIGSLNNGDTVYTGDVINISYLPTTGIEITGHGENTITVTGDISSEIYATYVGKAYTVSWNTGSNYDITVARTNSPYGNGSVGTLNSGDTVYCYDELQVTYTAKSGYRITSKGSESITVMGNVTSEQIYATADVNECTYNVVYMSTNGTYLGSDTVTRRYGETHSISPRGFYGYDTPAAQNVAWDTTDAKNITFLYIPTYIGSTTASGYISNDTYYKLSYDAAIEWQNRTANSVQIRVAWYTTLSGTNCYNAYGQWFRASCGGASTGNVCIVPQGSWSSKSSEARGAWAASDWMTIPLYTTGQTTIDVSVYYYQANYNGTDMSNSGVSNMSATWTATIPAY